MDAALGSILTYICFTGLRIFQQMRSIDLADKRQPKKAAQKARSRSAQGAAQRRQASRLSLRSLPGWSQWPHPCQVLGLQLLLSSFLARPTSELCLTLHACAAS